MYYVPYRLCTQLKFDPLGNLKKKDVANITGFGND